MTVTLMMLQLWKVQNLGTSEGYIYPMTTGMLCSLYNFRNLQLLCIYMYFMLDTEALRSVIPTKEDDYLSGESQFLTWFGRRLTPKRSVHPIGSRNH
jgi:hypothetical protein